MIIATLQQITDAFTPPSAGLLSPVQRLLTLSLPVRTAFHLKRAVEAVEAEYQRAESLRTELVKKYGAKTSKDDEPEAWRVEPEQLGAFAKEWSDLLSEPVEFPNVRPLTMDDLGNAQLMTADLFALGWLIVDEEPADNVTPIRAKKAKAKAA